MGAGRALSRALDPVLISAGFQAGQYGGAHDLNEAVQITHCTGHDEFSDRYPWLPQANQYERGLPLFCIDLVIDIDAGGVVQRIDLESLSLDETLQRIGHTEDAEACAELTGQGYGAAIDVLPGVLRRLFLDDAARSSV